MAQEYERSQYCYTHMCFSIPASLWPGILLGQNKWFGALKLQSNPFITKYYLIIVGFFHAHIYDIFYKKENTQSFNERATHFKLQPAVFMKYQLM